MPRPTISEELKKKTTTQNLPLAYRLQFKIDYKTGQALFQILTLGIMSDLGYETILFVW